MRKAASRVWDVNGRSGRPYLTLLLGLLLLIATGCAGSGELTRAQPAELIGDFQAFQVPVSLPLNKETDWNLRPRTADEPETEAQARAAEAYYQAYPRMGVLRQLGLMDVRVAIR
jgi:hypothetical protein